MIKVTAINKYNDAKHKTIFCESTSNSLTLISLDVES